MDEGVQYAPKVCKSCPQAQWLAEKRHIAAAKLEGIRRSFIPKDYISEARELTRPTFFVLFPDLDYELPILSNKRQMLLGSARMEEGDLQRPRAVDLQS